MQAKAMRDFAAKADHDGEQDQFRQAQMKVTIPIYKRRQPLPPPMSCITPLSGEA